MPQAGSIRFGAIAALVFGLLPGCFRELPGAGESAGKTSDDFYCSSPDDPARLADQVLQLVNLERADQDLPPVRRNEVLDKIADNYACRMISEGFFGHSDPQTGAGPRDRATAGKYAFNAIGENLAAGQESASEVMQVWMSSDAHRAIILDPQWVEVGLSVRTGGEYSIYWVQEFGAPPEQ